MPRKVYNSAISEAIRHLETAMGDRQTARYCEAVKDAITALYPHRVELGRETRLMVADTLRAMALLSPLCERELWFRIMVYDPHVVPLMARLRAMAS